MAIISDFLQQIFIIFGQMSPYLLLGFLFAGILHAFIPQQKIVRYFGGSGLRSSFNAALLGVPLPLCSCGVIPTGISFYKNGASKSSTVSFLISTPQTGVDSILVTYSLLGLPLAIIRPIIAFITGVTGGWLTSLNKEAGDTPSYKNIDTTEKHKNFSAKLVDIFRYGFIEFLQDITKWLVIGLLLASAISALIPDDFFTSFNVSPILQMLIVLVISIPMYICATASVPLAAVLILKGISPGAALVLLMAGPATNAATITMIGKSLGKKALVSYMASIIGGALVFGLIVDYILPHSWFTQSIHYHISHHHHGSNALLPIIASIVLTILLANGWLMKNWKKYPLFKQKINKNTMPTKTIIVRGMTCMHCKANVENNLKKLDFIQNATVDLPTGRVVLESQQIDIAKVKETIEGLGYSYRGEAEL
jgi:uncharacterized protein